MDAIPHKRVLQICHDYKGPFRAVCRQYVAAFEGHEVTTVFLCGEHSDEVAARVGGHEVIFLEQSPSAMRGLKVATLLRLKRRLSTRRFDVLVAHRYKAIYISVLLARLLEIPTILGVAHEHGVFRRIGRRAFMKLVGRNVTCIGVSESVSRDIEANCGPLAGRGRLYTLPNVLDMELAQGLIEGQPARQALGLEPDAFWFGTIGRLVAKKQHDVLLAGFAEFIGRRPEANARLVIIGGGPAQGQLEKLASDLAIADQVHFTGHVRDAWRYLRALDVFVLSSGIQEAFGVVLLEAMLAGVAIISSDAPGPREVVDDTARLFETGNARALADRLDMLFDMTAEERVTLAATARSRLEARYTPDAFRQRLWALPPLAANGGGAS